MTCVGGERGNANRYGRSERDKNDRNHRRCRRATAVLAARIFILFLAITTFLCSEAAQARQNLRGGRWRGPRGKVQTRNLMPHRPLDGVVLRGGADSACDGDDDTPSWARGEASEQEEEEPPCTEALQRMSGLVEGAREGRSGLVDGYALLQDLDDEGLPINTALFNEFLRMALELAKGGHVSTVDGERIVERLEHEGLVPDEDTYLQIMLLIAEAAKHKEGGIPKGFLSEGFDWLERIDKSGLNTTQPILDAYIDIYDTQMPNVYELDLYEYNWCINTESEDALWNGNPELGIEPHIKERYTQEVHACLCV